MHSRRDAMKFCALATGTLFAGTVTGSNQNGKSSSKIDCASSDDQNTIRRRGTGLKLYNPKLSSGGYTLFTPLYNSGNVYLIDINGEAVHQWKMPLDPGRDGVLLKNGNLGYNGKHKTSVNLYPFWDIWHGGDFREVTPDGDVVWRYEDIYHHHDGQWLPNGNLLYGAAAEPPAGFSKKIVGGSGSYEQTACDVVREVNRKGEAVWEWRTWEHLDPKKFPIHPAFRREHWPLINGVSLTRDGLVLMSLRTTSGIIAVDRKTKDVVWHVGPDVVTQQHTPVEMESGSILCFDNGNIRLDSETQYSQALEFDPKTGKTVWAYSDPSNFAAFFSPYMGSCQRLRNGNTLICESAFGRLFEVTPKGETVWEYIVPYFGSSSLFPGSYNDCFRAHRYMQDEIPWL